jgi:hypothetical protein
LVKRILVLGAFALGVGVAVRMSVAPVPAVAGPPESGGSGRPSPTVVAPAGVGDGRPRWEHVWTRPTPAALSASVSHDGSCVAWVDERGGVRRLDGANGATLWQAPPAPGVDHVLASPKGQVVGYSLLNPAHPTVRVYDAKFGARRAATLPVRGAVWSVALSDDGSRAVVGTGEGVVHTLPLAKSAPEKPAPAPKSSSTALVGPVVKAASCRLPGIPESLSLAGERPLVVLGTWNDAGVRLLDLNDLSEHWGSRDPQRDRSYRVRLSADGSTAVGVSARGPRGREARIDAWDAKTGRLLWREEIDGRDALAFVSADGSRVAVSYARMSSYRTGDDSLEYKAGAVRPRR